MKQTQETLPELVGGIIGCLVLLAIYLAVPVVFFLACLKFVLT